MLNVDDGMMLGHGVCHGVCSSIVVVSDFKAVAVARVFVAMVVVVAADHCCCNFVGVCC